VSVGRDTGYNLAAALAPVVLALVVTPFYLHLIGPDRFGILAICWTIVGALSFASLGMGPALGYRLALMDSAPVAARSNLFWAAVFTSLSASLAGALMVLAVARLYFQELAFVPPGLRNEIGAASIYLALLLPLGTLIGVLAGAFQGRKRFGLLSFVSIVNVSLGAILPLAVANLGNVNLAALIKATVVAYAIVVVVELAICSRIVPLRLPGRIRFGEVKSLLNFGAWMSVTAFIAPLLLVVDRLVLGVLRGPTAAAIYVLAYNMLLGVLYIPSSLSSAMLPRLAPLKLEADVDDLQSEWLLWLNGVLTPLVLVGIALSPPFFRLWIGPTLGGQAAPVATVLLLGCWFHGISQIASAVVIGRSRPDIQTKLLLVLLAPYLALLYFATERFGVMGAAAAWTIRAAFDPVLFRFTKPRAADLLTVSVSGVLVLAAMTAALTLSWTTWPYWGVMASLLAAACYQNRAILLDSLANVRLAASQGA
jgi:O-antigen/teichoic acid export membrane protein